MQAWIFKISSSLLWGKLGEYKGKDHLAPLTHSPVDALLLTEPAAHVCLLRNFHKYFTTLNCAAKLSNYTIKHNCSPQCHSRLSSRLRNHLAVHSAKHRTVEEDAMDDSIQQHIPCGHEWKRQKTKDTLISRQRWHCLTLLCLPSTDFYNWYRPQPLVKRGVRKICSGIAYVHEQVQAFHFPVYYIYSFYVRCTHARTGTARVF